MYYLKELKIEKFYLLDKPVHLRFNKNANYIIGKNGTGKSTLLEIIQAIFSLNFEYFIK